MSLSFGLGQLITLPLVFTSQSGTGPATPFDPVFISTVTVYNSSGDLVATLAPVRESLGNFYVQYFLPPNAPAGTWNYDYNYQASVSVGVKAESKPFTVVGTIIGDCVAHNFIGIGGCDDNCSKVFQGSEATSITLKGIPKRMYIFFTKNGQPFNPYAVNIYVEDRKGRTAYTGSYGTGEVKRETDGSYYVDLDAGFFGFAPQRYVFKWTYQKNVAAETVFAVSYLFVITTNIYSWFPRLRIQLDKSMKVQDRSFIGFLDSQLLYFLQGGLDNINMFPPMTSMFLEQWPQAFGQLLIDAATVVGLYSQKLFSVDTDVQTFSDQGFSYTVDHFSRLNTVLTELLTNVNATLTRFKWEYSGGPSVIVQSVPYFPMGILLSTAAPGSLFRNLFVAA